MDARKLIIDIALAAKDKSFIWTVAEIRSYLVAAVQQQFDQQQRYYYLNLYLPIWWLYQYRWL
jgi:hypothetical protein